MAIGLLCVLYGAADVTSRFASRMVGPDAAFLAFAPAAAIGNPQFMGTSTPGTLVPARLSIPSLGVTAAVESVGTKADGSMGTPSNFKNVGWYSLGVQPGAAGSAVFAGHVNNGLTSSGVFENLSKTKQGDYITVADASGKSLVYRVSSVAEYPANASTANLFATTGPSQIVLVTCDGDWIPAQKTFDKRLVVIAKPAY